MISLLIYALVSLSVAETNLDILYPKLEHSRTIYVIENGPKLNVMAEQGKVVTRRGGNVTLPCKIQRDQQLPPSNKMRIKWTKLTSDYLREVTINLNYNKKFSIFSVIMSSK
ncbi:hypothetical protein XENOCAPTIV_006828 [Xenoophorus captivus]|uniref:Ig-like domain-containing protein n=1 Tax=Xenoophorus captivus TaxID=1517983 RepID=A0ABV0QGW5_9TELE